MNYEEYETRMKAQKRKPVEREHYEEIVEKAYMALGDVDKDEFCGLSDKTIGAIRWLADRAETAERAAQKAIANERAAAEQLAAAQQANAEALKRIEELAANVAERNALLETLVADMTPGEVVRTMLAMA